MIISKKLKLKALFTGLICIFLFTGAHAENPIKIMLYGDSMMAGYGLSQNENLAQSSRVILKITILQSALLMLVFLETLLKMACPGWTGLLEISQT